MMATPDINIGTDVIYRTDGRNGLIYDLPAKVTVTRESHPGDYPDGSNNPLPVPDEGCVHLTVFTPGGFGSEPVVEDDVNSFGEPVPVDERFVGAPSFTPGSGTYVEWNVPFDDDVLTVHEGESIARRTWRLQV